MEFKTKTALAEWANDQTVASARPAHADARDRSHAFIGASLSYCA